METASVSVLVSAKDVIEAPGKFRTRSAPSLVDEPIKELLNDKKKAFIEWQNDISSTLKLGRFKHLQRQAQMALRRVQDEWWEEKVDDIETCVA